MFVTVNKPRSASTGDVRELLGHPWKTGNPTSMLNVEIVWRLGVERECEIDGGLIASNPEYTRV